MQESGPEEVVREAAVWAEAQPDPDPRTLMAHVYGEEGEGDGR